jgi:outer membrane protein
MFSRSIDAIRTGGRDAARFLAGLTLICFVAAPGAAEAADLLIGFVNSERIFQEYHGTKEAQTEFNADLQKWEQDLEARKLELQKLMEVYVSQSLILSEPRRRQFEEEIQTKRSELDGFVRDIWGPTGKVSQRNEQLMQPILERMNEVLQKIGEERGFSIIFDAADGNVVYADRALDLTDEVLQALNAEN